MSMEQNYGSLDDLLNRVEHMSLNQRMLTELLYVFSIQQIFYRTMAIFWTNGIFSLQYSPQSMELGILFSSFELSLRHMTTFIALKKSGNHFWQFGCN